MMKEKDKELRMQAMKIKELVYAGTDQHRQQIVRKDFGLLQSLASAASPNRHLQNLGSISQESLQKLEMQRLNQLKYGRVVPHAVSHNSNASRGPTQLSKLSGDNLDYSQASGRDGAMPSIDEHSEYMQSSSYATQLRSRSVDPNSKAAAMKKYNRASNALADLTLNIKTSHADSAKPGPHQFATSTKKNQRNNAAHNTSIDHAILLQDNQPQPFAPGGIDRPMPKKRQSI